MKTVLIKIKQLKYVVRMYMNQGERLHGRTLNINVKFPSADVEEECIQKKIINGGNVKCFYFAGQGEAKWGCYLIWEMVYFHK